MSPIRDRIWDGSAWRGRGGGDIAVLPDTRLSRAQRAALVVASTAAGAMTYIANANTTGLLPYWDEADLTPVGTGSSITLTGIIENSLIWGQIQPGSFGAPDLRNCVVTGPKPSGAAQWLVKSTSDTGAPALFTDCIVDPAYWMRADLSPPGGAVPDIVTFRFNSMQSIGIKGGRLTLRNTQIRNVQDGMQLAYHWVSASNTGFFDMQHCWVHSTLYYAGPLYPAQPEGTHSDLVQIQTGGNITIKWNTFGWISDGFGYSQIPAFNSGGGSHNAWFYIQQEVSNDQTRLVYNIEIAYNIFLGADVGEGYYINHYYDASKPNDMLGSSVHDNLFQDRSDGQYIIRNNAHYAYIYIGTTNRRVSVNLAMLTWTDLGAVPIANG